MCNVTTHSWDKENCKCKANPKCAAGEIWTYGNPFCHGCQTYWGNCTRYPNLAFSNGMMPQFGCFCENGFVKTAKGCEDGAKICGPRS